MSKVYLITAEYIKQNSQINENVDEKILNPLILTVQDMHIHPAIGTGLFNQLKTQISGNGLSNDNKTLLDNYIIPCMIYWVMYDAPFDLTYKFMNKSVVKRNSDNSNSADINELITIANKYKEKAEFYLERLNRFLVANATTYPLFLNPGNGIDTLIPNHEAYQTGMNLDFETPKKSSLQYNKNAHLLKCGCFGTCGCYGVAIPL